MSFLDEVNNAASSENEKKQIISEADLWLDETKRTWLNTHYEILKNNILDKAKKLSCSSFDGLLPIFSMRANIPYELLHKLSEYNVNHSRLGHGYVIHLGNIINNRKTVTEEQTRIKKVFFKSKTISYTVNVEKSEIYLDDELKEMLKNLVERAKNDGINIDTSCIYLGRERILDRKIDFFLNDIDDTLLDHNRLNHPDFIFDDISEPTEKINGSIKDFINDTTRFFKTNGYYLEKMLKVGKCPYGTHFCDILLQLKYSI